MNNPEKVNAEPIDFLGCNKENANLLHYRRRELKERAKVNCYVLWVTIVGLSVVKLARHIFRTKGLFPLYGSDILHALQYIGLHTVMFLQFYLLFGSKSLHSSLTTSNDNNKHIINIINTKSLRLSPNNFVESIQER